MSAYRRPPGCEPVLPEWLTLGHITPHHFLSPLEFLVNVVLVREPSSSSVKCSGMHMSPLTAVPRCSRVPFLGLAGKSLQLNGLPMCDISPGRTVKWWLVSCFLQILGASCWIFIRDHEQPVPWGAKAAMPNGSGVVEVLPCASCVTLGESANFSASFSSIE